MENLNAEFIEQGFKEVWAMFKETELRFKETDKEFEKMISKLGDRWGEFVERIVAPAAVRLFRERGIDVERIHQRSEAHINGRTMEIDVLVVNKIYAVVVEVKSRFTDSDIKDFLDKLKEFKEFFPDYKDKKIFGAIAAIVMGENVKKFAYKQGLFVIAQRGDTVQIVNDEKFEPKSW